MMNLAYTRMYKARILCHAFYEAVEPVLLHSGRRFSGCVTLMQQKMSTVDESLTVTTQTDGIRTVTLNNPRKRNALSLAMLESLQNALVHNMLDKDLRVIVIRSKGPVFSSGHDLSEMTEDSGKEHHTKVFDVCSQVMTLVQDMPVPVIAQVQGLATAAGCQLVASCDVAVAGKSSQFATPGVNIGLFCSTPGVALGRAVPRKKALEMLFTGFPISANEALQHGLVSKVVEDDEVEAETMRIAEKICRTSRSVVALGKACFYAQMNLSRNDAYKQASKVMVANLEMKDGKEGIKAFLEKRKPTWSHDTD